MAYNDARTKPNDNHMINIGVRVTVPENAAYQKAAAKAKITKSQWIRNVLQQKINEVDNS